MKNKNGFTLVEIVISIALLGVLALLVIPGYASYEKSSKEKVYNSKINIALKGAYKYGKENVDELNSNCKEITIGALINLGYVEGDDENGYNLINPMTQKSMNNIVLCVYYIDGEVKTQVKE